MVTHSLRRKFALLLGGLGLAIGVIVYTNFDTSNTVASRLDATREQFLPRLIAANSLRERFKTMSLLLENAAVEGESGYLEESDTVSLRLFRDLDLLTTLTPQASRAELMELGRSVAEYHRLARMLAEAFLEESLDDLFHGDEIESLAG
jgi:aminoglycoside phosphotransferase family enzyme